MSKLDRLTISGFKSIREQEIELGPLNVLIGANGAGKSNLIGVFRLLNAIVRQHLQVAVAEAGGANNFLHFGSKRTQELELNFWFDPNGYKVRLRPTAEDSLFFVEEVTYFHERSYKDPYDTLIGAGHVESSLAQAVQKGPSSRIAGHVLSAIQSWKIYHFHDTSTSARVKRTGNVDDNEHLRGDASNLAAFLYRLEKTDPAYYRNIVDTVRLVAPFFDRFNLRRNPLNPETIKLEWKERGSDDYFSGQALSDGTLRFICLATLLLQPKLPATILIDEPELGLHPYAIHLLAEMLQAAATKTQLIVATQSVTLVNQLSPEDLIIVDRKDGESIFSKPTKAEIAGWMDHYSLGELWEKNLLAGRPAPSLSSS